MSEPREAKQFPRPTVAPPGPIPGGPPPALDAERERDHADASRWRAAEAEGHVVDFTTTGYGLMHPPSCRPDLLGCDFNSYLASCDEPDLLPGRYSMRWTPSQVPLYTLLCTPSCLPKKPTDE